MVLTVGFQRRGLLDKCRDEVEWLAFKDEVDLSNLGNKVEDVLEKNLGGWEGFIYTSIDTLAHRSDTIRSNGKRALGCMRRISQWMIRRRAVLRGS